MAHAKKVAYILRHSPYHSDFAHDAIDAVLAGGLYAQAVSLFFMGDGVFQLLDQKAKEKKIGSKPLSKKLSALSLYDIDNIYVCSDSLAARGIEQNQLCIDVNVLDKQSINNSIRDNSAILSF